MSEPAGDTSPMKEICTHLAALTQAVQALQDNYNRLEGQVQNLAGSNPPASSSAAAPTQTASGPAVVMLPPEPRVPIPERFSGDRAVSDLPQCLPALFYLTAQNFFTGSH